MKGAGITSLLETFKNVEHMRFSQVMPRLKSESMQFRNSEQSIKSERHHMINDCFQTPSTRNRRE